MTQYNIKTTKPKPYEVIGIELHDGTKTKAYLSECWEGQYGYRETTSMATYDESDITIWWKLDNMELDENIESGVLTKDQTDEQKEEIIRHEKIKVMNKEELIEDILDIINSENSGLSHQQRLNEIEKLVNLVSLWRQSDKPKQR